MTINDTNEPGRLATRTVPIQRKETGETVTFTADHVAGVHEAYFVHVRQEDAPGDQDDAWTAPIWIDPAISPEAPHHVDDLELPANVLFVGSKGSGVYHHPDCGVVHNFRPGNLVQSTNTPSGKRLHKNCPTN